MAGIDSALARYRSRAGRVTRSVIDLEELCAIARRLADGEITREEAEALVDALSYEVPAP